MSRCARVSRPISTRSTTSSCPTTTRPSSASGGRQSGTDLTALRGELTDFGGAWHRSRKLRNSPAVPGMLRWSDGLRPARGPQRREAANHTTRPRAKRARQRSAGLQTGIARAAGETPTAPNPRCRELHRATAKRWQRSAHHPQGVRAATCRSAKIALSERRPRLPDGGFHVQENHSGRRRPRTHRGARHCRGRVRTSAPCTSRTPARRPPRRPSSGVSPRSTASGTRSREAFKNAQEIDPDFALAYWGEAVSHNHPLWSEQDISAAREVLKRFGDTRAARRAKTPDRARAPLHGHRGGPLRPR